MAGGNGRMIGTPAGDAKHTMSNVVPFPSMPDRAKMSRGPERRRKSRGGRRTDDTSGFAPLVLLVGDDSSTIDASEAVLAKLRFAVTTSPGVDEALRVLAGLRPDIVVADADAASRIRIEAPEHVPVVVMTEAMREDREALIDGIRQALRANPPGR